MATLGKFPVPLEVISFAQALVQHKVEALGASVNLRMVRRQGLPDRRRPSHSRLPLRRNSRCPRPGPQTKRHARHSRARPLRQNGQRSPNSQRHPSNRTSVAPWSAEAQLPLSPNVTRITDGQRQPSCRHHQTRVDCPTHVAPRLQTGILGPSSVAVQSQAPHPKSPP